MRALLSRRWVRATLVVLILFAVLAAVLIPLFLGSPYYALLQVSSDIREEGISGLRGHLSAEALSDFDAIETLTEDEVVGAIIALFGKDDYMRLVKAHLPDLTWSFSGVTRRGDHASVILDFRYVERFNGRLELTMERQDRWLITRFDILELQENDR
ncbi:MAG: hypothetical protein IJ519_00090 [Clostridia bacterium]|nr:hypothetical protein [Clostridia bacterium]